MSRKAGQIISLGEHVWLIRVYLGCDRGKHVNGSTTTEQSTVLYRKHRLTKRLHEGDLGRCIEGVQAGFA